MKPKRRNGMYYIKVDGVEREFPSVTKIINDTLNKPALIRWAGITCTRIALKNPELSEKEVMSEFGLGTRASQTRGQGVHNIAERMPDIKEEDIPIDYINYYKALKSWWETHEPKRIGQEIELYSVQYCVAGRCDFICTLGTHEEKWLIDFKTGKALYNEVGVQLAIYKQMLSEMKICDINKMGAVLLKDDGGFVFREYTDTLEDFLNVYKVWQWIQRRD